jgi:flavin reductase (DIM6/NTAB) family NADH-FMN oxidoreductase RutF
VRSQPYSFFNAFAFDPPTLCFGSVARPNLPGGDSDSVRNLRETGSCVVHIISEWFIEAANHTCGSYDYNVEEHEVAGFTTLPS